MSNMSSVIKQHNCKLLCNDFLCSCRDKDSCPLDGKYLQTCIDTRLMSLWEWVHFKKYQVTVKSFEELCSKIIYL